MNCEGFIDGTPVFEPSRPGVNNAVMSTLPSGARIRGTGNVTFPSMAERRALDELLHAILDRHRNEFTVTE